MQGERNQAHCSPAVIGPLAAPVFLVIERIERGRDRENERSGTSRDIITRSSSSTAAADAPECSSAGPITEKKNNKMLCIIIDRE
jgi:hypothetical protein